MYETRPYYYGTKKRKIIRFSRVFGGGVKITRHSVGKGARFFPQSLSVFCAKPARFLRKGAQAFAVKFCK